MHFFLAGERGKQSARGSLDQVEHVIEALGAAEEGIGHVPGPYVRRKIEEGADLGARFMRRAGLELGII